MRYTSVILLSQTLTAVASRYGTENRNLNHHNLNYDAVSKGIVSNRTVIFYGL